MSRFMKVYGPVEEGLGYAAIKMLPSGFTVFLVGLATGGIGWAAVITYWLALHFIQCTSYQLSLSKIVEFLSDAKIHSYIENMSAKAYKQTKKDYPKLVEFLSERASELHKQRTMAKITAGTKTNLCNLLLLSTDIEQVSYKHTIAVFGDTTHVEQIYAVFMDTDSKKYICVPLETPTKDKLKSVIG